MSTAHINEALIAPIRQSARSVLAAVASRDLDKARTYAAERQIPRFYGSYEALIRDDALRVIYISLPNHLHVEWTIRALEAGKHVLCEKPLVLAPGDIHRIAEVSDRTGCHVAEAFMYRHHERTLRVKRLVDEGAIGRVRHLEGAFTFPLSDPANVRLAPELGGGSLWDVGCYPVSFARFLLGAEPIAAFARQEIGPSGVDIQFAGHLAFPGHVNLQFLSGFAHAPRMEFRIVGTEGVIELPQAFKPGASSLILMHRDGETEKVPVEGRPLYLDEVEDMVDACLLGTPPRITLEESLGNVRALVALYEAANEERVVFLEDS